MHTEIAFAMLFALQASIGTGAAPVSLKPTSLDNRHLPSDTIRGILEQRIARRGAIGLVVGRITDGRSEIVAAGSRGATDRTPVDAQTVFEIGSVSKVFTTTLLAEMVVRGEVALDDPVAKYLPDTVRVPSHQGREITLLDLATQRSALARVPTNMRPAEPANPYADYDVAKLYAFLDSYTLPRAPGAAYEYSNTGMGLLGHVLALRAGRSYEELVTERILAPLGMHDTRIALTADMRARLASGHNADHERVPNWDLDALAGAGAWRSTASDMMRFIAAAMNPPDNHVGRALALATEPRLDAGSPNLSIGLGWHILQQGGRRIVWHNGQTGGYHAFIGFDPASGSNAVVIANTATSIDDIGMHLVNPAMPIQHPAPPRPTVVVDREVLDSYVGRYELAPQFVLDVTRVGDALYVQATGQPRFRLFAASPAVFFLRAVEAELEFRLEPDGTVTGVVLRQGGRETPGRRLPRG